MIVEENRDHRANLLTGMTDNYLRVLLNEDSSYIGKLVQGLGAESHSHGLLSEKLFKEDFPLEKEYIINKKEEKKMSDCIFCKIINGEIKSKLYIKTGRWWPLKISIRRGRLSTF